MFEPTDKLKSKYTRRSEVVFLLFSGLFLGSLAMLNILGMSRFIDLSFYVFDIKIPFQFGVGVLAYPLTFLCTDFISELYGKKRASRVVWIGLLLNFFVIGIMWLGSILSPVDHLLEINITSETFHKPLLALDSLAALNPDIYNAPFINGLQMLDTLNNQVCCDVSVCVEKAESLLQIYPEYKFANFSFAVNSLDTLLVHHGKISYSGLPPFPDMSNYEGSDWAFFRIKQLTSGSVMASMIAYLAAQFVDVHIFHALKKLTKGKHLWIRNNFSTLFSQLVDSTAVILIIHFYAHALPLNDTEPVLNQIMVFIYSTYVFKIIAALLDTIPFYFGTNFLSRYLNINLEYLKKDDKK